MTLTTTFASVAGRIDEPGSIELLEFVVAEESLFAEVEFGAESRTPDNRNGRSYRLPQTLALREGLPRRMLVDQNYALRQRRLDGHQARFGFFSQLLSLIVSR